MAFGTAALVAVVFLVVVVFLVDVEGFLIATLVVVALLAVVAFLAAVVFLVVVVFLFFLASCVFPTGVGAGVVSPIEAASTAGPTSTSGVVSLISGAGEAITEALSDMANSEEEYE